MTYLCTDIPFYVYTIICVPTGQYYYGSRYSHTRMGNQPEQDLWIYYFTSSQSVHDLIKTHTRDQFETFILKKSTSKDEVYWYEQGLISDHINDPLCLNLMYVKKEPYSMSFKPNATAWLHLVTGQRRIAYESPGEEWVKAPGTTAGKQGYHNEEGENRFFDEHPGEGWFIGHNKSDKHGWWFYSNTFNRNRIWYNNGETSIMRHSWPGPGWQEGRISWTCDKACSDDRKIKIGNANRGKTAYNNGSVTVMRHEHPGPGWSQGRLHNEGTSLKRSSALKGKQGNTAGMRWWHKDDKQTLSKSCPGPGWAPGQLPKT